MMVLCQASQPPHPLRPFTRTSLSVEDRVFLHRTRQSTLCATSAGRVRSGQKSLMQPNLRSAGIGGLDQAVFSCASLLMYEVEPVPACSQAWQLSAMAVALLAFTAIVGFEPGLACSEFCRTSLIESVSNQEMNSSGCAAMQGRTRGLQQVRLRGLVC